MRGAAARRKVNTISYNNTNNHKQQKQRKRQKQHAQQNQSKKNKQQTKLTGRVQKVGVSPHHALHYRNNPHGGVLCAGWENK